MEKRRDKARTQFSFSHPLSCRYMQAITRISTTAVTESGLPFRTIPLATVMRAQSPKSDVVVLIQAKYDGGLEQKTGREMRGRFASFKEETWRPPECGRRVMENSALLNLVT